MHRKNKYHCATGQQWPLKELFYHLKRINLPNISKRCLFTSFVCCSIVKLKGGIFIFNSLPNRDGLFSTKFEVLKTYGADVIPMWVADMDFPVCDCIVKALENRASAPSFGYTDRDLSFYQTVKTWVKRQHDMNVHEDDIILTTGVVQSLHVAIRTFSKVDDFVLVLTPAYPPFYEVVLENNRKLLTFEITNYSIDMDLLLNQIQSYPIKLIIVCNPHNPLGICWSKEDLKKLATICKEKGIILVSDEIHSDLVYAPSKHISLLSAHDSMENSLVLMSPCKTFNIAGLKVSYALIKDKKMKEQFYTEAQLSCVHSINLFALTALSAAYSYCDEWLFELKKYLQSNRDYIYDRIKKELPKAKMHLPDATYLAWIDASGYDIENPKEFLLEKAKILVNAGTDYGHSFKCYFRLNFATSREQLCEAINRMVKAFASL